MNVTVIIPCLNASATLAVQLEALSKQTYSEPWGLIIADNGSTDNSVEIANKYKEKFHSFKVIDASKRKGKSYATNVAINVASSEKIACCDADDEVCDKWLESIVTSLETHKVVCGTFRFDKFNEPEVAKKKEQRWKHGLFQGDFLPGGGSGNYGIYKNIHLSIGGFDENLPHAEDADYFWRIQLSGYKLYCDPNAIIQIRVGRVNPTFSYMFRRGRIRAACNYWNYLRYKDYGMHRPSSIKKSFVRWIRTIKIGLSLCLKGNGVNRDWLSKLALNSGSVIGEIQGRISNPLKPIEVSG